MQRISESLAGRASYLSLWPMTHREQLGMGCGGKLGELLTTPVVNWIKLFKTDTTQQEDWREFALHGGFPTPAVLMKTPYMLVRLPAFAINRTKRLIKAPKLYWGDTGLALSLAGHTEPSGAHLENVVLHDLLAWRDARIEHTEISYWRTAHGEEVDFVLHTGGRLLPVEVKSPTRPSLRDCQTLRRFRAEYADTSLPGLLLHAGEDIEWLAADVLAAPWWRVV